MPSLTSLFLNILMNLSDVSHVRYNKTILSPNDLTMYFKSSLIQNLTFNIQGIPYLHHTSSGTTCNNNINETLIYHVPFLHSYAISMHYI